MTVNFQLLRRIAFWFCTVGLIAFTVAYVFLWRQNKAIAHPLPISNGNLLTAANSSKNNERQLTEQYIKLIISEPLQPYLHGALANFNTHYPQIFLTLIYQTDAQIIEKISQGTSVDIIIADSILVPKIKNQLIKASRAKTSEHKNTLSAEPIVFSFALTEDINKNSDIAIDSDVNSIPKLQGLIPSTNQDNSAVTTLHQYLLASSTQDLLRKEGLSSIDSYNNKVDDLFNPEGSFSTKTAAEKISIANAVE